MVRLCKCSAQFAAAAAAVPGLPIADKSCFQLHAVSTYFEGGTGYCLAACLSFQAKKADADFQALRLMCDCFAVNGFQCCFDIRCLASNQSSQRLMALSPGFVFLQAWLMLKHWKALDSGYPKRSAA